MPKKPPVALVTGASSGIGRELALRLARDGYAVGLAARRVDRLEAVAARIRAEGGVATVCPCDVAVRSDVHGAVARVREDLGSVALLVANAGVSTVTDARALDSAEVEAMMSVNFFGAVYAAEAVLPEMIARDHGHLVVVGSLAGYGGLPRSASYSASKGALHNFFESLRAELYDSGVDVTVIAPGWVRTEMTDRSDHTRPFILGVEDAVDRIARAIRRRHRLHAFPRPLSSLAWLAQIVPRGLYDRLVSRVRRAKH